MNGRNSNVELLKVFAMFGVVVSHVVQSMDYMYINGVRILEQDREICNITEFIMFMMRNLGQIGNIIFVVCSAWYLLERSETSIKKVVRIIADNFVISVILLIGFTMLGYGNIGWPTRIRLLLPTTFGVNWFITCYILLYMIHPVLNFLIKNMSQKKLLSVNILFLVLYGNMNIIDGNIFFYSEIIGFIWIYFIVAYVKTYMHSFMKSKKANIIILLIGIVSYVVFIWGIQLMSAYFTIFQNKLLLFSRITNPFFIIIAVALFNLAYQRRAWINTKVNYISSALMLVYLIHQNYFAVSVVRVKLLTALLEKMTVSRMLLVAIIASVLIFITSVCLSVLYKQIVQRSTNSIIQNIVVILEKTYGKIINFLMNITAESK